MTDQPKTFGGNNRKPNCFLSVRITSDEIKRNIALVQKEMVKQMPQMEELLQDVATLHITLMVLKLKSDDDVEKYVKLVFTL